MMRDSMSRPSASVPSGKVQLPPSYQAGGSFTNWRYCSSGECGASQPAKMPVKAIATNMMRPVSAPLFSRNDAQNSASGVGGAVAVNGAVMVMSAAMADARVDGALEQGD